jgi:hypothetical protein
MPFDFLPGNGMSDALRGPVAAVLLLQAFNTSMDTMSALNSSPWTSENFGADPDKAKSSREYVTHSLVVSGGMCLLASVIAKSSVPIIGWALISAYLWWLYDRALKRGAAAGSSDWTNP